MADEIGIVEAVEAGALRLRFLDDSEIRLGSAARVTLDNFVYDPAGISVTVHLIGQVANLGVYCRVQELSALSPKIENDHSRASLYR